MGQDREKHYSRRAFLSTAIAGSVLAAKFPLMEVLAAGEMKVSSPNGEVQFQLSSCALTSVIEIFTLRMGW